MHFSIIDCFYFKVRQQMKPDMAVKEVLIGKYCHVQVSSVHSHVIHSLPAADAVVVVVFFCFFLLWLLLLLLLLSCHSFLILVAVAFATSVCGQHEKPFDVIELNYDFDANVFLLLLFLPLSFFYFRCNTFIFVAVLLEPYSETQK